MTVVGDVGEIDCPWFDDEWLLDHPEFPLNSALTSSGAARRVDPTEAAA